MATEDAPKMTEWAAGVVHTVTFCSNSVVGKKTRDA